MWWPFSLGLRFQNNGSKYGGEHTIEITKFNLLCLTHCEEGEGSSLYAEFMLLGIVITHVTPRTANQTEK